MEIHLSREMIVSAKNNNFLGAGALTCVTRQRYGIWQIGPHHNVHQRSHFTTVSISRYVKLITSGRFLQI